MTKYIWEFLQGFLASHHICTTLAKRIVTNMTLILALGSASLSILNASGEAEEGGWSGNGGDLYHTQNNIWNLGSEPIEYCIHQGPSYPVHESQLQIIVRDSLVSWKKFFQDYGIDKRPLVLENPKATITLPTSQTLYLALNFTPSDTCDTGVDGEQVGDKLHFYFDQTNTVIDKYKAFHNEGSLGLALRKGFDHKTFRNGGYIWIGNFSQDLKKIKHMVLHELGHVFGMLHDSVFVMSETIANDFQNPRIPVEWWGNIEAPVWPYRWKNGESLILSTMQRGRRPENNNNANPCLIPDYQPNILLPAIIRKQLDMLRQGCHKLTMTINDSTVNVRNKTVILEVETPRTETPRTNSARKIRGAFTVVKKQKRKLLLPGVYTKAQVHPKTQIRSSSRVLTRWTWIPADNPSTVLALKGSFNLGQHRLAARIDQEKGVVLELFLPQQNNWWSFRSFDFPEE